MNNPLPKAREITTHRVNGLNEKLRVFVLDGPGSGGACHEYAILVPMSPEDEFAEAHMPYAPSRWCSYGLTSMPTAPGEFRGTSLHLAIAGTAAKVSSWDSQDETDDSLYYNAVRVSFQNGPIKEQGVNGLSQEALIAVLIDRLEGFQSGQFKCHDNELALDHLQYARLMLHKRTMDRVARDVEGTLNP